MYICIYTHTHSRNHTHTEPVNTHQLKRAYEISSLKRENRKKSKNIKKNMCKNIHVKLMFPPFNTYKFIEIIIVYVCSNFRYIEALMD